MDEPTSSWLNESFIDGQTPLYGNWQSEVDDHFQHGTGLILDSLGENLDSLSFFSIPTVFALLSVGYLISRVSSHFASNQGRQDQERNDDAFDGVDKEGGVIAKNEGIGRLLWKVARLLGCAALVGLSVPSVLKALTNEGTGFEHYTAKFLLLSNAWALVLSFLSISTPGWHWTSRHSTLILFSELAVYAYRDVWPLATFRNEPLDMAEGWVLWAKIGALFLTALVVPVCIPSAYRPVDPKHPAKQPHPEQTASVLSFNTYSYLSPTITIANKLPHLTPDDMPPIADYDRAEHLAKASLSAVDPVKLRKGRHIGLSLLRLFAYDYFVGVIAMTVHTVGQFAAPVAINRILVLLESGQTDETPVRPLFWILCLFFVPVLGSMGFQYYVTTMNHVVVRTESILTQLIFNYSLRIRVVSEGSEKDGDGDKKKKDTSSFIGKLNNLVTADLASVTQGNHFVMLFWYFPLQIACSSVFLYLILGWSAFVGLGLMVALLPVPGYLTGLLQGVQTEKMKKTDDRTQTLTESMGVLRTIKLFGWEKKIQEKVDKRREEELKLVWKWRVVLMFIMLVTQLIPIFTMLATYAVAALVMKIELTASKIFSSMIVFGNLRDELGRSSMILSSIVRGRVSIDRFNAFFKETDLLDSYEFTESSSAIVQPQPVEDDGLYLRNASFTWTPEANGESTPSSSFKLTVPGELRFMEGKINLIVGPTGSGKTSLLMALLGEMHFAPSEPDSSFNLPRAGGVAFAVQESWVQNETIRENILFHSTYDEERYKKVLYQCALEPDLELFEAGDATEVGERGLTLSGGQKARLTLARAIYSDAQIILLDDVLAALDVHTAKWVVNKCLKGDLVKGRTVLLVTHNIALARPITDFIVTVSSTGVVTGHGQDISEVLQAEPTLQAEYEKDELAIAEDDSLIDAPAEKEKKASGKLIVAEEVQHGTVSWKALKLLLKGLGGHHVVLFFTLWIGGHISENLMASFNLWFLGRWSSQYETHRPEEVPVVKYLGIYVGLTFISLAINFSKDIWFTLGSMRASKTIHKLLTETVLGATLRVITRLTQDIQSLDSTLVIYGDGVVSLVFVVSISLVSAVLFVPIFALPGLLIAGLGIFIGSRYLKAQLSVKRELSNAKSPMLSHFSAAIAGLVSIRAYGAQDIFKIESRRRIDHYLRISRLNYDLNRWIGIRIDSLGAVFTASLAAYLTYASTTSAANVGFSLNRAVEFTVTILYMVRVFNVFQVEANSMERIAAYLEIEQEPKPTESGKPPASWPTSGDLRVENLTARYSKAGPAVLHDLTFDIRAGERIGVVGRTGSGKSTLTLALLRGIITEGTVYFDGLATNKINLDALRSHVTIIPQSPELLSGSLRYNLDPFDEYDDATLNAALKSSGLYASQGDSDEGRLSLDTTIASGGNNVSAGQRQIIALARAIVRSTKLLILDEATSAIDHETDAIIQNTLRRELGSDVTVLTIAHRLQTIMDADRIMVLDAGNIVEFASPKVLLAKEKGFFKALVDESGDKDHFYEVAEKKGSSSTA
ncbi:hypothetical protein EST38_g4368 [Candolleomyces aberdarensis]|uniref:P-loop containing nucleoside triphosphate hydrolase protein n=1 Tax=Candolleomyces aberdarensis TaxID=2316362 RepID=A0A4Q2DN62_9AGAR|nr:hypothetical protein EST38_g4368 [Candolleomyces aberdarensis]